ncbi:MAG: TetR/AcrR family transcriptional regulator [Alphaproteobacteria bacterium]
MRQISDLSKARIDDPALVERRRAQLTAAAIETFSDRGFHSTTIRDVAVRAGVSIGLIYQYVKDKDDLLLLALMEVLNSYRRRIPPALDGVADPLERFCTAVRAYCHVNGENREATVLAYRETKSLSKKRRDLIKQLECETNELLAACVRDCVAAGLFRRDLDVELFTYQIVMFSHAWALKAWRFASQMAVDEYVDRGLRLMLFPVLTGAGEARFGSALAAKPAGKASAAARVAATRKRRRRA